MPSISVLLPEPFSPTKNVTGMLNDSSRSVRMTGTLNGNAVDGCFLSETVRRWLMGNDAWKWGVAPDCRVLSRSNSPAHIPRYATLSRRRARVAARVHAERLAAQAHARGRSRHASIRGQVWRRSRSLGTYRSDSRFRLRTPSERRAFADGWP